MMNPDDRFQLVTSVDFPEPNKTSTVPSWILLFKHKCSISITKPTYLHQLKYINPNPTISTMSAPYSGRQSPPPERQSGAQLQDTPGSGKTDVGKHPAPEFSQQSSEYFRDNVLTSNPEHPLEKIEAEKYTKGKQH